jgi:hypothetical protein
MKIIKFYPLIQAGAVAVTDVELEDGATIQDMLDKLGIVAPQSTVYFGQWRYQRDDPERNMATVVPACCTIYWRAGAPPPVHVFNDCCFDDEPCTEDCEAYWNAYWADYCAACAEEGCDNCCECDCS